MSGACDNFILEDQSCEWFDLIQYIESFDMGVNFLEGPPGPPGPAGEAIFIPSVSEDGWISWTNTAGLPNPDPVYIKGPPGGGGSGDYDDLTDKPSINGVTLSGNKTTAELLISFSAADVGLGNVANERQYSAQNPPPYPVTSVAGKVGAISLLPSDVGLGNVANERQYSAQNPPPYPVTSVNGMTGDVVISGGGAVDSVNGQTGTVVLDAADVGALPATTVIPDSTSDLINDSGFVNAAGAAAAAIPTVIADNSYISGSPYEADKTYTVSGNGVVVVYASTYSDKSNDTGTFTAEIYHNGTLIFASGTRLSSANAWEYGQAASCAISVSNGDSIRVYLRNSKTGTPSVFRRFLCFGCTVL